MDTKILATVVSFNEDKSEINVKLADNSMIMAQCPIEFREKIKIDLQVFLDKGNPPFIVGTRTPPLTVTSI